MLDDQHVCASPRANHVDLSSSSTSYPFWVCRNKPEHLSRVYPRLRDLLDQFRGKTLRHWVQVPGDNHRVDYMYSTLGEARRACLSLATVWNMLVRCVSIIWSEMDQPGGPSDIMHDAPWLHSIFIKLCRKMANEYLNVECSRDWANSHWQVRSQSGIIAVEPLWIDVPESRLT